MLTWRGEYDSATMTAFIPSCIMWSFCVAISLASDPTYSYHHHVLSVGLPVSDVLATAPTDLLLTLAHKHPLCSFEMIGLTLVWPDWLDVRGLLVATSKLSWGTSSNYLIYLFFYWSHLIMYMICIDNGTWNTHYTKWEYLLYTVCSFGEVKKSKLEKYTN